MPAESATTVCSLNKANWHGSLNKANWHEQSLVRWVVVAEKCRVNQREPSERLRHFVFRFIVL